MAQADAVVQQDFAQLDRDFEQSMQAVWFLEDVRSKLDLADPPKFRLET
ncbi:MAG: hypothetical protein ACPGGK_01165 [Pikeienuella sp.]